MDMTRRNSRESGLSLIELIVAMGLSLAVLAGAYNLFKSQTRVHLIHNQVMGLQDSARFAFDSIVRDLQMAGYDAEGSRVFGITAYEDSDFAFNDESTLSLTVTNQIYFTTDSDGDSEIDNNSSERFGYRLNSGNLESASISTADGSISSWDILIDNVETLSFVYTYSNGTLSSTVGLPNNAAANRHFRDIRSVTVSLRVKASQPDPGYTDPDSGDNYRRTTLTGKVFPRNLSF